MVLGCVDSGISAIGYNSHPRRQTDNREAKFKGICQCNAAGEMHEGFNNETGFEMDLGRGHILRIKRE